mgnify:CR=1 FL=1
MIRRHLIVLSEFFQPGLKLLNGIRIFRISISIVYFIGIFLQIVEFPDVIGIKMDKFIPLCS